jgi:hypothetical protein
VTLARWVLALVALAAPATAQGPPRILETTQTPTVIDRSDPDWAGAICGGKTAFTPGGARYEWTPVIPGFGQYGSDEAVTGWALGAHRSGADVPFTHPFGKVDFGYYLLPDPQFDDLLAPRNREFGDDDVERNQAKTDADGFVAGQGLPAVTGLLGVEQDIDLIPEQFRPREKTIERVAVFGRWIIDCGHDNWHSEIHPPLLTAVARPDAGANLTHVTLVARPYLVDQEFENGGILDELAHDLALVNSPLPFIPFIDRVSAQASFLPPTHGLQVVSFQIRPPTPPPSPQHRLHFRMHVTARPGVIVQPFWVDDETIGVIGLFTDALTLLPVTGTHDWDVSGSELTALHKDAGMAWNAMVVQIGGGMGDFIKAAVLAQGLRAILYDTAPPPDLTQAPVTEGWAGGSSWGQNPVRIDANQPYPLIGWMEVQWRLPTGPIGSSVDKGAWRAVQRHLDELRLQSPASRRNAAAYASTVSALAGDALPRPADDPSGKWRFRLRGAPGQPNEAGLLWLRTNGRLVQGVMEGPGKRQDLLGGEVSADSKGLLLVRALGEGREERIRLTRQGRGYVGTVEGTQRTMELAPAP